MGQIRIEQQCIIAFHLYEMRMRPDTEENPNPWLGYGDSNGDWNYAGRILDHFEDFSNSIKWKEDEEDFNGFRNFLTKGYLEYLQQIKAKEEDSCSN